jgi:DNA-binding LacI/PurR family transcriptional regulator
MRVTQLDIARLAQVSQATVSRVLAGDDHVDCAIRERVLEVMRQQNYQPDVRARSLRLRRTGLIGLVIKRPHGDLNDDPFFSALISGIVDELGGKPYHLCVEVVSDDVSQSGVYDEMLRTRRVDGLILVESEAVDERIARLQKDRFPFVVIGNPHRDTIASVDNDNVRAGEIATRHLVEAGYRRIGFLGGPHGVTVSDDRRDGYQRVVASAGIAPRTWHTSFGFEAARRATLEILASDDWPDALVVLDDYMACGAILAAREWNLQVPQDLGIVGFNNSSLCRIVDGGLTSVSLSLDRMVRTAVAKLLDIIDENPSASPTRILVPCTLEIRGTSAGPRPALEEVTS